METKSKKRKAEKYWNITISGKIGTGTTTLAQGLKKKLGWRVWSAGDFVRDYVKQHGLKLEETGARSDEFAKMIDYGMRERLEKEQHLILEAWLGGFMAQGIPGVLKVLLVSPDNLRIDRTVNRDHITVEEAKHHIKKRERENDLKWERLYATEWKEWVSNRPINFYIHELYDLVIDTYSHSKEETLDHVLKKLKRSSRGS